MTNKYDEIINLPHHISKKHPQLGVDSYAAQFSPFAALTGYEEIVSETSRATEEKTELDNDAKLRLSEKLSVVLENSDKAPVVTITYFVPDKKKTGGKYTVIEGTVKKYDAYEKTILLSDGTKIQLDDLYDISGDILPDEL